MEHVVLLVIWVAPVAQCYSSGQVMDSCKNLQPNHSGHSPQTNSAPFVITTDRSSYNHQDKVTVHLQAPASTPFTGFLLQAREVGAVAPLGFFMLITGAAQLLTCNQTLNSAVSHTSDSAKTSIQVTWSSGASGQAKPIQFHASFVKNYQIFWTDVKSPILQFNDSTVGFTSSPSMTTAMMTPTGAPPVSISRANCGVSKVCFSQPSDCDPAVSENCYFMSAMMSSRSDVAFHYELTGSSDGYISFGFSDDQIMGNDDIYICGFGRNGLVHVQHAYSTGRKSPEILPLGNISDVKTSVHDKVISCSFSSTNPISTQRTSGFNKTYYLMFAHGPTTSGQIQFHTDTFISSEKIDISRPQLVSEARWPHIIKAHGALMLIAWMTTGSLGMMVARYLKGLAKGHKVCSNKIWFVVHVVVMSVTVAATIIGFILSFSYAKDWSGGAHPVLGCLVLILSVIQPVVALLRCGPDHPLRVLFNSSHALNAFVVKAIAVAAIFTGLKLIDTTFNQWLLKVMGGFLGWEVVFYILHEVHFRWKSSDTKKPRCRTTVTVLHGKPDILGGTACWNRHVLKRMATINSFHCLYNEEAKFLGNFVKHL
ncbi:putative ferric-chelate reductase 1 isoform X2 [Thalassophryne amazonica]|uniref:putative ferric-chelate reductase 1 isoform X2 n=1 Tax=Thalassophryne amazonica TaxID=390379 RepID=UPI0014714488|nr:putative ferric-chelate reductase 1 isoform X2 [Thalassophryne amazonica]